MMGIPKPFVNIFTSKMQQGRVLRFSLEFRNLAVLLTGAQQTRMNDLLRTLGEMLNLETDIQFSGQHATGHYVRTPILSNLMCPENSLAAVT